MLKCASNLRFKSFQILFATNCNRKQNFCSKHETTDGNEATTSFGYQTVRESEKAGKGIDLKKEKKKHFCFCCCQS